jgi:hypothetical protein
MVRTQIQLTEEQSSLLKRISNQRKISVSELIRQGVDFYLRSCGNISDEERRQRAVAAAGKFHSGLKDLSSNHDKYLPEAYN